MVHSHNGFKFILKDYLHFYCINEENKKERMNKKLSKETLEIGRN